MSRYSICEKCGADIIVKNGSCRVCPSTKSAEVLGIPFACPMCGGLYVSYRPTLDRVFIWSDPIPETYLKDGSIVIPEQIRNEKVSERGTVLAFGPGYYGNKRFHPVVDLHVGSRVIYDNTVPWRIAIPDSNGKKHVIKIMGFKDIRISIVP